LPLIRRHLPQIVIAVSGGLAIAMAYMDGLWQAASPLVGLAGQPFWLLATWQKKQWGMFALSLWYTGVFILNACRFWL
jgi:hypothetical protein